MKLRLMTAFTSLMITASSLPVWASKILYIGDSHSVGCFGKSIENKLRAAKVNGQKFAVTFRASCGSSTTSWLNANGANTTCGFRDCSATGNCRDGNSATLPPIFKTLDLIQPQITVVALGTNMIMRARDRTIEEVTSIGNGISERGSKCIWIGPPQASTSFTSINHFDAFERDLKKAAIDARCLYISSATATDRSKISDRMGLHYGCTDATQWALKIASTLEEKVIESSSGPIAPDRNRPPVK